MGRGHPDYGSPVFPAMPTLGEGQTVWFRTAAKDLGPAGLSREIDYQVPEGYELYITGAIISCNASIITRCELVYGEAYGLSFVGVVYYDTNFIMPITGYNRLVVPALQYVGVNVYNDDLFPHSYSVCLIGFLQEKE